MKVIINKKIDASLISDASAYLKETFGAEVLELSFDSAPSENNDGVASNYATLNAILENEEWIRWDYLVILEDFVPGCEKLIESTYKGLFEPRGCVSCGACFSDFDTGLGVCKADRPWYGYAVVRKANGEAMMHFFDKRLFSFIKKLGEARGTSHAAGSQAVSQATESVAYISGTSALGNAAQAGTSHAAASQAAAAQGTALHAAFTLDDIAALYKEEDEFKELII